MFSNSCAWNSVQFKETLLKNLAVCPWLPLFKNVVVSFLIPVILCTQIVPFKSVAFEGALQILSAALIRQSDIFTLLEWLSFIRLQFAIWSVLKRDKEEMRLRNSPEAGWPFYPACPEGSILVVSKTFVLLNGSARNALFIMFLLGVFKVIWCTGCQLNICHSHKILGKRIDPTPHRCLSSPSLFPHILVLSNPVVLTGIFVALIYSCSSALVHLLSVTCQSFFNLWGVIRLNYNAAKRII